MLLRRPAKLTGAGRLGCRYTDDVDGITHRAVCDVCGLSWCVCIRFGAASYAKRRVLRLV